MGVGLGELVGWGGGIGIRIRMDCAQVWSSLVYLVADGSGAVKLGRGVCDGIVWFCGSWIGDGEGRDCAGVVDPAG